MALTAAMVKFLNLGSINGRIVDATFDNSYPAGGYVCTAIDNLGARLGMPNAVDAVIWRWKGAYTLTRGTARLYYDDSTNALRLFEQGLKTGSTAPNATFFPTKGGKAADVEGAETALVLPGTLSATNYRLVRPLEVPTGESYYNALVMRLIIIGR